MKRGELFSLGRKFFLNSRVSQVANYIVRHVWGEIYLNRNTMFVEDSFFFFTLFSSSLDDLQ